MTVGSLSSDLCDGLKWQFGKAQESSSKYSFGEALGDLTVVGTIYNIGGDLAIKDRNDRAISWIQGIQTKLPAESFANILAEESKRFFAGEKSALNRSLLSKVAYLGAVGAVIAGFWRERLLPAGLIASIGLGAYFMGKAGFAMNDHSMEQKLDFLSGLRKEIQSNAGKL